MNRVRIPVDDITATVPAAGDWLVMLGSLAKRSDAAYHKQRLHRTYAEPVRQACSPALRHLAERDYTEAMREHFLLDPALVFLNHGSFGACPIPVLQAQHKWQCEMERNPVEFLARRSATLLREARNALALYLGCDGADLVFVPNATTGVDLIARSLRYGPDDEILTTDLEYGACDAAWQRACAQTGIRYRRVPVPMPFRAEQMTERLLAAITPNTRLIFLSHITSATALTMPVHALCGRLRERGILTLIDGAHAPGQIDVNIASLGADFYVGNCHKWLCAPKGSAFVHAQAQHKDKLDATVTSWGYVPGVEQRGEFAAYLGDTAFERRLQWQGTRDISAWLAVPAAIEFQRSHDWPARRAQCHELAQTALEALTRRHKTQAIGQSTDWAQMVAIPVSAQDPYRLRRQLFDDSGIEIAVTAHAQQVFVRLSVQAYNSSADIECLLKAPALQ